MDQHSDVMRFIYPTVCYFISLFLLWDFNVFIIIIFIPFVIQLFY